MAARFRGRRTLEGKHAKADLFGASYHATRPDHALINRLGTTGRACYHAVKVFCVHTCEPTAVGSQRRDPTAYRVQDLCVMARICKHGISGTSTFQYRVSSGTDTQVPRYLAHLRKHAFNSLFIRFDSMCQWHALGLGLWRPW